MLKSMKRLLSFVMVLAMVMSYVVMPAAAETTENLPEHTHTWVDGVCSDETCKAVCGHEDVTVEDTASCEAAGVKTTNCNICGVVTTVDTEAKGHSYSDGSVSMDATCQQKGELTYTCNASGNTYSEETDFGGHNYAEGACLVCGEADPDDVAPGCDKCTMVEGQHAADCITLCLGNYDCEALTHTRECPGYDWCTELGCDLETNTHHADCPFGPCTKTEGCELVKGHDGECTGASLLDTFNAESDKVKIADTGYETLSEAYDAFNTMTGAVVVEIYGEVEFTNNMELRGSYDSISFVGNSENAKITINQSAGGDYLEAHGKTVSFKNLTLAKANPAWSGNSGHMGNYFSIQGGTVTYDTCTFANGACTSGGTATYTNCTFNNTSEYGLWVYDDAKVTVSGGTIGSVKGIKIYSEDETSVTSTLKVENATFTANVTSKPAVAIGYAEKVELLGNTYNNTTGVLELDSGADADCEGVEFVARDASGNDIAGTLTAKDRSNKDAACGVVMDGKLYTTVAEAVKEAEAGDKVVVLYNDTTTVEFPAGVEVTYAEGVTPNPNITVKPTVAKINNVPYESLKEAINAVANGDTITLVDDCDENVTFTQTANVSFVLDGGNKTYTGSINITARAGLDASSTLTIKNFNFTTTESAHDFIQSVETNYYPNNITISDCTFTGTSDIQTEKYSVVAVRMKSANNLKIQNCTGTGLHSFLQNTAGWNIELDNVDVTNSLGGFAMGSAQGVTIRNCDLNVTDMGIRVDALYPATTTIENCNVKAFIPVVVRKASADASLVFEGTNTMTEKNTDGYWCVIGTSEYEVNGSLPTAPTGEVKVTLNDTGLTRAGIYPNFVAKVGNTHYTNIETAITALETNGGVLTLLDNVTTSTTVNVASGKEVTIDLNGHNYTYACTAETEAPTDAFKNEGGTLTLTNSGTTGKFVDAKEDLSTDREFIYNASGTLNITNCELETTRIAVWNTGTANLSGAKITNTGANSTYYYAVQNNGAMEIKNSNITADAGVVANGIGATALTIEGSTLTGNSDGDNAPHAYTVYNGRGTTTIESGDFSGNAESICAGSEGTVNVKGGTFAGSVVTYGKDATTYGTVNIYGGTFNSTADNALGEGAGKHGSFTANGEINIDGGSFKADPADYLMEEHCTKQENGYNVVGDSVMTEHKATDSNCTESGKLPHYTCGYCGKVFKDEAHTTELESIVDNTKPALDHNMKWHNSDPKVHWQYCDRCEYKTDSKAHDFEEVTANAKSVLVKNFQCKTCGYSYEEKQHIHELGDWKSNDTEHYKICEAADCDDPAGTKFQSAAHTFGQWQKGQTADVEYRECTVCHHAETRHVHVYSGFYANDSQHWKVCTSKDCDASGTKFFAEDHNWGDWKNGKADGTAKATWRHKICKTCGHHINRPAPWAYSDNPKTGDYIATAVGIMAISAAALVVLLTANKKKRR